MPGIPDRWLSYSPIGEPIPGTRFICFKVPLKTELCNNLEVDDRFTPEMLMEQIPNLGLIVDLTNTKRYYNSQVFKSRGIRYKKIYCPGQVVPAGNVVKEFFTTVDAFLRESVGQDSLVGVHCTHGLNRTGYFICRYLNLRMGFEPQDAISAFEKARGYKIEREPFIADIVSGRVIEDDIVGHYNAGVVADIKPEFSRVRRNSYLQRNEMSRFNNYSDYTRQVPPMRNDHAPVQQRRRDTFVYESPCANTYDDYAIHGGCFSRGSTAPKERTSLHQIKGHQRPTPYVVPPRDNFRSYGSGSSSNGHRNQMGNLQKKNNNSTNYYAQRGSSASFTNVNRGGGAGNMRYSRGGRAGNTRYSRGGRAGNMRYSRGGSFRR